MSSHVNTCKFECQQIMNIIGIRLIKTMIWNLFAYKRKKGGNPPCLAYTFMYLWVKQMSIP